MVLMSAKLNVVLGGGSGIAGPLRNRLGSLGGGTWKVRSSPVLDNWDMLTDVCRGADLVYLLSALDLPDAPDRATLRTFKTGVARVLECCQECGVSGLVFTSSSDVISETEGHDLTEDTSFVTSREDEAAHAIAMAEAEVLKASETQNLGGSSCLYTCALRPAPIYGTEDDRGILRALSWVGWGLNRVGLGSKDVRRDLLHAGNLAEAEVRAGVKILEGAVGSQAGRAGRGLHTPVCSGRAYNVTDGTRYNPQEFLNDILDGLGFQTKKVVCIPRVVALATAHVAEFVCKIGLTERPVWSRAEVRQLTESRTLSIDRLREDLGYQPVVDSRTALRLTVEGLKEAGWGRHTFLVPALGYWLGIPLGMWLITIAASEELCPAFLAPVQRLAFFLAINVFRRLWVVRLAAVMAHTAHVLEGIYAYRLAKGAGHGDTAPLWLVQTLILGYPSTRLVRQLIL